MPDSKHVAFWVPLDTKHVELLQYECFVLEEMFKGTLSFATAGSGNSEVTAQINYEVHSFPYLTNSSKYASLSAKILLLYIVRPDHL